MFLLRSKTTMRPTQNSTSSSTQVQGTNDCSIVSKLSMVNQGYLEDPYLKFFVQNAQRRSPVINRGYYIRSKAVRHVVSQFVAARNQKCVQIVSLGAGFDTTFFNLKDIMGEKCILNLKFVEIDYSAVISRKVKLAQASNLLQNETHQSTDRNIIFSDGTYCAVAFDLKRVGPSLKLTMRNCGLDLTIPTLFLSEVVLTYLTSAQSQKIIKWIQHTFANALLVVFEQMLPDDGFGRVMTRHFESCGSPLLAIKEYPTLFSQKRRHEALGFYTTTGLDMYSFFQQHISAEEKRKIQNLEIFDEFEAWHLTCFHYFILCSTNSEQSDIQAFCKSCLTGRDEQNAEVPLETAKMQALDENGKNLKFFGHCACQLSTGRSGNDTHKLLAFGGFGISSQQAQKKSSHHHRLLEITFVDLVSEQYHNCTPNNLNIKTSLYCTLVQKTPSSRTMELVLFGGRSSPKCASNDAHLITVDAETELSNVETMHRGHVVPEARWRHTANVIKSHSNSQYEMLVFGGRDENTVYGNCWSLDLNALKWTKVLLKVSDVDIELRRHSHASAVWCTGNGELLLVSGGVNRHEMPTDDLIAIKFLGNGEAVADRLDVQPTLPAIYSHTMHVHNNHYLILVGGLWMPDPEKHYQDPNCLCDQVAIVDLLSNAWIKAVRLEQPLSNFPIMLHGHQSYVFGTGDKIEIVIVGGGANCFSFGTSLNRTPLLFNIAL